MKHISLRKLKILMLEKICFLSHLILCNIAVMIFSVNITTLKWKVYRQIIWKC